MIDARAFWDWWRDEGEQAVYAAAYCLFTPGEDHQPKHIGVIATMAVENVMTAKLGPNPHDPDAD